MPQPIPHHRLTALVVLALAGVPAASRAATPAEVLTGYAQQAGAPQAAARGQAFFNATHGREWSCSSCHGAAPTGQKCQPLPRMAIIRLSKEYSAICHQGS